MMVCGVVEGNVAGAELLRATAVVSSVARVLSDSQEVIEGNRRHVTYGVDFGGV